MYGACSLSAPLLSQLISDWSKRNGKRIIFENILTIILSSYLLLNTIHNNVTCLSGGANLFSVGQSWPLNSHFIFEVVAVFVLLTAALSFMLPKSIEKKEGTKSNLQAPESPAKQEPEESDVFLKSADVDDNDSDGG